MIRALVLAVALFVAGTTAEKCIVDVETGVPDDWVFKDTECIPAMNKQIRKEITASITYLSFASHFSRDTVNRPGFAKFFFDAASEERHHAKLLIDYLMMRGSFNIGDTLKELNETRISIASQAESSTDVVDIVKKALLLEHEVTNSIKGVIKSCENDYHLSDYLSGDFLLEQYQGMRDLAGKMSTLNKLVLEKSSEIGLFIVDKKLLNGEVL